MKKLLTPMQFRGQHRGSVIKKLEEISISAHMGSRFVLQQILLLSGGQRITMAQACHTVLLSVQMMMWMISLRFH